MTTFHTYIGECCREWPMAAGFPPGRCGICQQVPEFKREDDQCSCEFCVKCHLCDSTDVVYTDILRLRWCRKHYDQIYLEKDG